MENWPERPADMGDIPSDDPEIKKDAKVYATAKNTSNPILTAFERVSSWNKLKKIMAWVLRYKTNLRKRAKDCDDNDTPPEKQDDTKAFKTITVQEMNEAEREILRLVQNDSYPDEIRCVAQCDPQNSQGKRKSIRKSSHIYKLDPIVVNDLLCVGGRLQQAPIDNEAKHPIILPKKHHVVNLIIRHFHNLSGHSGTEYTLL
ncbi:Hypothetical predicted protein [Paramuricea clavata]|nr:Hypothetical predicted protein [Paramuricea clavata]